MNNDFERARPERDAAERDVHGRDDLERADDTSRWAIELLKSRGLLRRTEDDVRTTVRTTAGDERIAASEDRRSPRERG